MMMMIFAQSALSSLRRLRRLRRRRRKSRGKDASLVRGVGARRGDPDAHDNTFKSAAAGVVGVEEEDKALNKK